MSPLGKAAFLTPTTLFIHSSLAHGGPWSGWVGHPSTKQQSRYPQHLVQTAPLIQSSHMDTSAMLWNCFLSRCCCGMQGELEGLCLPQWLWLWDLVRPLAVKPSSHESLRCYRSWQSAMSCCHRLPASAALQTWRWLLQRLWERGWAGQHVVSDQSCYCHSKPAVLAGSSPGCDMGFLRALLTGWQRL